MDYLQMLYIVTIAESASMTQAAEKLCLSQSALSLSYRKLEAELGVSLFRREGRRLVLTSEGELFCSEARAILERVAELTERMKQLGTQSKQKIVLCSEAMDFSNEAIKIFRAAYPDITFQQINVSTKETADMLRSGQVQIAVTSADLSDDMVTSVLLLDEPMYVMIHRSSELSDHPSVNMAQLAGLPLITQSEGHGISSLVKYFYEKAHIQSGNVREVGDQESIGIQVINDYGIGFIPESIARSHIPSTMFSSVDVVPVPLTDEFCRRQVFLSFANVNGCSKALDGFVEFLVLFGKFAEINHRYPTLDEVSVLGHYRLAEKS